MMLRNATHLNLVRASQDKRWDVCAVWAYRFRPPDITPTSLAARNREAVKRKKRNAC